jgi:hypothetical protein
LQRLLETAARSGAASLINRSLLTAQCSDFNALLKMQLFWLARPGCARLEEDLQSDDDAVAK